MISPPLALAAMREARMTDEPKRSPSSSIRFAGVEADADVEGFGHVVVAFVEGPLQGHCAFNGPGDAGERGHEAVPHRLDLGAAVRFQDVARDALVLAEDRTALLVAEAAHHLGVANDVREEDGDDA